MCGKFIDGASAFWLSTKLMPTMSLFWFFKKKRMPWNRHVSPAQRRVHDTQRGNSSDRYRLDMHRANCSSGLSGPAVSGFVASSPSTRMAPAAGAASM